MLETEFSALYAKCGKPAYDMRYFCQRIGSAGFEKIFAVMRMLKMCLTLVDQAHLKKQLHAERNVQINLMGACTSEADFRNCLRGGMKRPF